MSEDADIDGLAAEYVLGSLPPAERTAVRQRLGNDQALAPAVVAWQLRLAPLSLREPGIAPPPQSLERVLAEITRQAVAGQNAEGVVALRRVGRWRLAATGLAAAAIALAITLGLHMDRIAAPPDPLVAVLAKGDTSAADEPAGPAGSAAPIFLATVDSTGGVLTVRQTGGRPAAAERTYAVWLTPANAASMMFVGFLSRTEPATRLPLPLNAGGDRVGRVWVGGTLTISLESGPPGQAPAGPILSTGKLEPTTR